jgi:hypothetical protein
VPHCLAACCFALLQLPVPGSVASLQMTPQGVVRSFYPIKGNEAALNHNLFRGAAVLKPCEVSVETSSL